MRFKRNWGSLRDHRRTVYAFVRVKGALRWDRIRFGIRAAARPRGPGRKLHFITGNKSLLDSFKSKRSMAR